MSVLRFMLQMNFMKIFSVGVSVHLVWVYHSFSMSWTVAGTYKTKVYFHCKKHYFFNPKDKWLRTKTLLEHCVVSPFPFWIKENLSLSQVAFGNMYFSPDTNSISRVSGFYDPELLRRHSSTGKGLNILSQKVDPAYLFGFIKRIINY